LNAIVGHMKADADEENAGAMSVTTPATRGDAAGMK
jgi:hypothetical protein